jgi:hypothetical protein
MRAIYVFYNGRLKPVGQLDTSWAAWLICCGKRSSVAEKNKRYAETIISLMQAGF